MTEGAYVQASTATLLATVQQLDRVYVDVTQASSESCGCGAISQPDASRRTRQEKPA